MGNISDKERSFAVVLKSCRHAAGLTQKDVAEASGLSTSYIALIEAGERNPPRRPVIERLAKACNVNEAFLVRASKNGCDSQLADFVSEDGEQLDQYTGSDLNAANGKLLSSLVQILEDSAPELSHSQIFQKIVGLPLWWRFFIICHHENMTGKLLLTQREKLLVQEKVRELEGLDSWLLPCGQSVMRDSNALFLTKATPESANVKKSISDTQKGSSEMIQALLSMASLDECACSKKGTCDTT